MTFALFVIITLILFLIICLCVSVSKHNELKHEYNVRWGPWSKLQQTETPGGRDMYTGEWIPATTLKYQYIYIMK